MNNIQLIIGCDPELFLRRKDTGQFVSAHDLLPGTKEKPIRIHNTGGAVQVDGTAAEINIVPANNSKLFQHRISRVMSAINQQLLNGEYELVPDTVVRYDKDVWDAIPKKAKELGCDPDFNAYTGEVNPVPNQEADFRTGAGHIHIGWTKDVDPHDEDHFEACRALTRQLDYLMGVGLQYFEGPNERRDLYGKAGAFRPKSYGCEYRVPSNFWLKHPMLMEWVFAKAKASFDHLVRHGVDAAEEMREGAMSSHLIKSYLNGEGDRDYQEYVITRTRPMLAGFKRNLIGRGVIRV